MSALASVLSRPLRPGLRAVHLLERNALLYRRSPMVVISGFFEPVFYLAGIGFGLGRLVGGVSGPGGAEIPYALFVAPALLAASAMNGAITEGTYNFYFKLTHDRTFESILSTPLSPRDVAVGELGWALVRGGIYATGFTVIMAVLGLVASPWMLLAIPAALLVGFAFGAVAMAATSFMRSWQDFDLIQLVVLPLFLFSGTFFPLEAYPEPVRLLVQLTPLYHGVDLLRSLAVGAVHPGLLVHVAYLLALGAIGLALVSRRVGRLLLK